MPLDVRPSPEGTLVLRAQAGDDGEEVLDEPMLAIDHRSVVDKRADEPRFVSHFATCRNAAQHRKPKGAP